MNNKQPGRKGRPTAKREVARQKNKRPLTEEFPSAAGRKKPPISDAARLQAQEGFARGDDKFLPLRDRGPQRRFVRDYVDARFHVTELVVPAVVVVIGITFFLPILPHEARSYLMYFWYAMLFVVFVDQLVLRSSLTRALYRQFGKGNIERGLMWYATSRSIQPRIVRMPRPIKRRD